MDSIRLNELYINTALYTLKLGLFKNRFANVHFLPPAVLVHMLQAMDIMPGKY